jgi:hypothetical protein
VLNDIESYIHTYPKTSISIALACVILLVLLRGCFVVAADRQERYVNLALLGMGLALGWIAGISLSPVTAAEGAMFREYGSAVAAFGSGYLVGKADRLVSRLFDPDLYGKGQNVFRAASVAVVFLVTMAVIFILRTNSMIEHNPPS